MALYKIIDSVAVKINKEKKDDEEEKNPDE